MTDRITLTGLSAIGIHGLFDEERRAGQTFVVDVVVEVDTSPAAQNDAIADTVNYADIAGRVHAHIVGEPVNLIETLAENIAADVLGVYAVEAVEVTVHKPQAPIPHEFADVSVTIRRERR